MKIDKEYPATHSMSTAWYCVDENGNVGIIDIEDNGPVPVGGYTQSCVEEVFWDDFSIDNGDYIKDFKLEPEQISSLLIEPAECCSDWEKSEYGWLNPDWAETIIKIDMSKIDMLKLTLSKDKSTFRPRPICLSMDEGLFYVDLFYNKEGVEILEKNNVIMARYKAPHYSTQWAEGFEEKVFPRLLS